MTGRRSVIEGRRRRQCRRMTQPEPKPRQEEEAQQPATEWKTGDAQDGERDAADGDPGEEAEPEGGTSDWSG